MRRTAAIIACVGICLAARPARPLDIEWVLVGNPGNPPDRTGQGSVAEEFEIMRHEVTCGAYAEFLNAVAATDTHGLWDPAMGSALAHDTDPPPRRIGDDRVSPATIDRIGRDGGYRYRAAAGRERMPVVNVSFLDAMRFANWLHHSNASAADADRRSEVTEAGAYEVAAAGGRAARSAGARVWIPTDDEWHKAAYHQPEAAGGPPGGYWLYPTSSDAPPAFRPAGAAEPNIANFLDESVPGRLPSDIGRRPRSEFISLFAVGSHPSAASHYGTLDQGGNAWEWTESIAFESQRIMRGGSMAHPVAKLRSNVRSHASPESHYRDTGFRLARRPAAPQATGGDP